MTRRLQRPLKARLGPLLAALGPHGQIDHRTYAIDDVGQRKEVPLTFFHRHGLMALRAVVDGKIRPLVREEPSAWCETGVLRQDGLEVIVREPVGQEQFVVDWEALAAFRPPEHATDEFTLRVNADASSSRVESNPLGTRLEPIAAQWLWDQRNEAEHDWVWQQREVSEEKALTIAASAWCTACGRHFKDERVVRGEIGCKTVARWCPSCHKTRKAHRPQLRACAA